MPASKDPVVTQSMLKEAVEDISTIIGDFSNRVDERFNVLEAEVRELNVKYDHLITTLDAFLKRLDDMETENTARDAHLARLDRWLHQLADDAGIQLK